MRERCRVIVLVAMSVIIGAGAARAQICAGFPTTDRQFSVGANLHFPEDATQFGAEGSYDAAGPFAAHAGASRLSFDDSDFDRTVFTAGVAFDFAISGTPTRPFFSICPLARIDYAKEGGVTFRAIPVGVGIGSSIPLAAGGTTSLMPYLIPAVTFSRVSGNGGSVSETDFALRAGALIGFGTFFFGGEVSRMFVSNSDLAFGFRAGLRL